MSIEKNINPLWRLVDPLTVNQAAALIAGYDPNCTRFNSSGGVYFESESGLTDTDGIDWVKTAFSALVNAINAGKLPATIRRDARLQAWDEHPSPGEEVRRLDDGDDNNQDCVIFTLAPDWGKTTVVVSDLVAWLAAAGIRAGHFFPDTSDQPDYLNTSDPRYAPKLAAAVRAWQAVTDPGGRAPKQALAKWLREHAAEFDMAGDDGNPINQAIEDVSKVANWQPGGGAPKTPGS